MDSICISQFTSGSCYNPACTNAHRLSDLSNPKNWVIFYAPGLEMLDFLPYKFQSHHFFQSISLPETGPLVRFATPEDAETVVHEYRDYYSPAHLPEVLAQAQPVQVKYPQADVAALDALCRRELRLLQKRIPKGLVRDLSCLSTASSSDYTLSPMSPPCRMYSHPSVESLDMEVFMTPSRSLDDISSECNSSDSNPSSPVTGKSLPTRMVPSSVAAPMQRHTKPYTEQRADRSSGIIGVLQAHALQGPGYVGWSALEQLWGLTPSCLDEAVLTYLTRKSPSEQEQILLSFAAIDLGAIQNLSAYLNCLIKEHETTSQVCLHFLAGLCDHHEDCRYIHPVNTTGWNLLNARWGITYADFDYAVLNYLSKKPVFQQDEILTLFAEMNLKAVKNRSAYLSSMIERYERVGLRKRSRARGTKVPRGRPTMA